MLIQHLSVYLELQIEKTYLHKFLRYTDQFFRAPQVLKQNYEFKKGD